jgi:hypothetical protein
MGITRNELKSIIKECLVEILVEGMGTSPVNAIQESKKKYLTKSNTTPHVSSVLRNNASKIKVQQKVNPAIRDAIIRESGGNDVMASILADTAEKTLPTMIENDRTKLVPQSSGGSVERIVASANPEELFGKETTSKWAELAFMTLPNK